MLICQRILSSKETESGKYDIDICGKEAEIEILPIVISSDSKIFEVGVALCENCLHVIYGSEIINR